MQLEIRKVVTYTEEIHSEGGRPVDPPVRLAAAMAVIKNPLAGIWAPDLSELVETHARPLGELLGKLCVQTLGGEVEAYGKGALVGADGEVEHGSALIHTLKFGNRFRDAAGGTSLLPSAEKRGAMGAALDIALKHKHDHKIRSHHMTFEVRVPDAPRSDEIVVICAACNSGRPHDRAGSLLTELAAAGDH